ncbi:EpsG family protein [Eubacterium maltosivorans]|nr:EpsG family protein [Eubacterium maltosivorans]
MKNSMEKNIYIINLVLSLFWGWIFLVKGSLKRKKIIYLTIVFLQMFFLAGFRSINVGYDTEQYVNYFYILSNTDFSQLFQQASTLYIEPGYAIMNKIIALFTSDYQWLLIIMSFVTLLGYAIFIYRCSDNVYLSVFLFITLGFFYFTMRVMRQALAIMLICNAIYYLYKNKKTPFVILVLFASTIHSSAIFFLLLLLIPKLNSLEKLEKFLVIITVIFVIGTINFNVLFEKILLIVPKYSVYASKYDFAYRGWGTSDIMIFITQILFLFLVLYMLNNNKKYFSKISLEERKQIYFNVIYFFLGIGTLYLSTKIVLLDRMNFYFQIILVILIPKVFSEFKKWWFFAYSALFGCLLAYNSFLLEEGFKISKMLYEFCF